ncbi:hypothetical protein P3W45_001375 [Vairimorpha bombi]|jgi:T-complex protein 1 subunit theta
MNMQQMISQSQTEEKAKYATVIKKITSLISIFDKLYGQSYHKKLIQTDYNTLKLTSFPSVILDNIKINHPLVKLMIEYVKKLDTMGDSSKFFLLFVKYLVEESIKIVEKGVKPTILGEIYRDIGGDIDDLCRELVKEIEIPSFKSSENVKENTVKSDESDEISVENRISELNMSILPTFSLLLDSLIKDKKIKDLLTECINKTKSFSTEKIRICKINAGTLDDSYLVEGMVFEKEPESTRKSLKNGSSSIYNCPLDICRAELKSTILMNTSDELYNYSKDEIDLIKNKVENLKSDLIICSGKVDNIFLDFCNKNNKMVFKIMSKHDLRRIRECLGGYISPVLESLTEDQYGTVKNVEVFTESNKNYTKFIGNDIQTIVLKNSLDVVLDEQERIINKTLRAISKNIKNNKIKVVEGAGKFEKNMENIFKKNMANVYSNTDINILSKKYAYESLSKAFSKFKKFDNNIFDIYNTKVKAIKYALDFTAVMYETEDYLIGVQEKMNIKPRMNEDWDEDH